ncbi:hypothetical protein J3R82DRAFT_8988 [Butyriboletus roseoflavus]|nr:hypothetical protein J3R82DRAFT_8988 [Butyriboletus roseoflavus]
MSPNVTTRQKLDELFPAPSLPPSQLSPQRLPGANLESLAALRDVLKDNHQRYHIYFNHLHFHNHITHRILAIYALGGSAAIIRDYYKRDGEIQRPAFEAPEPITEENFVDHLGDENFYQGYVSFFSKQISEKGAASTLEEFVFSEKYNFQKGRDANTQPEMLARFFGGFLHPLIHIGYGVEFGLKGMLVEGLAMTAVHDADVKGSHLPLLFSTVGTDSVDHITNHLSSFALDAPASTNTPIVSKTGGVHAFDIVARILKDDKLNRRAPADYAERFKELLVEYSPTIREHAEQWTVDLNQPGEVGRKIEELVWLSSLVYGPGGLTPNGHRSDFFLMHLVTSSLFLPSLIAYLSPRSQVLLLRGYLYTVLTLWVMRGRPALNIKSFMTTTSVEPEVPTTAAPGTPFTTETTPTPNPFLPVLQSAIAHPIDHLIKIQRAFAHFDTLYGTRPAGYFKGTELEDAELLDGTLFLRAALLTADYTGWVREGKEPQQFSFEGFFT